MSLRTRLGLILFGILIGGVALTAPLTARQSSTTVSGITIVGGVLSGIIRQPAADSVSRPDSQERLALTVTDERGRRTGWSVTIAGLEFAGAASLPFAHPDAGDPGIEVQAGNPDRSSHTTSDMLPVTHDQSLLWAAANGGGDGEYRLELTAAPSDSRGNHLTGYESIVVVTLIGNVP